MKMFFFLVCLSLPLVLHAVEGESDTRCREEVVGPFETHFSRFLESVRTRDWDVFIEYLEPGTDIIAVLPDGKVHTGYTAFLETQKGYFSGKTGVFTYKVRKVEESGEMGFGSIDATYEDVGTDGARFRLTLYISFVFKKRQSGGWYMIHDQNALRGKELLDE
ncbi:MAG: nuclear transport factor 2 family protein [Bdellovibrionales bacterium]|nr:nuclear transport factor 2 family protein [Bdellovibrionales bacterium]